MSIHAFPAARNVITNAHARPSREKSEARPANYLWLDKNENTDPEYLDLMHNIFQQSDFNLAHYPDCHQFYEKLASFLQVEINQLILAPGSDGIIRMVFEAFVAPGDTVLYTEPTFAMYALYARMYAANEVVLDYAPSKQGPVLSLEMVLETLQAVKPRLFCLPNPNSPTGTVFTAAELTQILSHAGEVGCVVLIDEAYYPFYPHTTQKMLNTFPHLIIARTFSKAWGLAGIRLGYGIANPTVMQALHKIRPMYEVGDLSLQIASRMLDYQHEMEKSVARLNAGKNYFCHELTQVGFKTLKNHGNFLHVAFGNVEPQIYTALSRHVLYRRDFEHPSLRGYSRFSSTTIAKFKPIIAIIETCTLKELQHA